MLKSDATKIVMKIKARFPKWFVDEFTQAEWVAELAELATDDVAYVWSIIEVELSKQTDGYPPPLSRLRYAVGSELGKLKRSEQRALPAPEEDSEPQLSPEQAAEYMDEIRKRLAQPVAGQEDKPPKFGFESKDSPTSDDLEPDTLKRT